MYDFEDLYNSIGVDNLKIKITEFNKFNSLVIGYEFLRDLFNFVVLENYLYDVENVYKQFKYISIGWSGSNLTFNDIFLYMYEEDISANEDLKFSFQ